MIFALPPLNAAEREARGALAFTGISQHAVGAALRAVRDFAFPPRGAFPDDVLAEAKIQARDQIARRLASEDAPTSAYECAHAGFEAAILVFRRYLEMRN